MSLFNIGRRLIRGSLSQIKVVPLYLGALGGVSPALDALDGLPRESRTPPVGRIAPAEGACFLSMMRVYTCEFRESAVGLLLSQGLSVRVAAAYFAREQS